PYPTLFRSPPPAEALERADGRGGGTRDDVERAVDLPGQAPDRLTIAHVRDEQTIGPRDAIRIGAPHRLREAARGVPPLHLERVRPRVDDEGNSRARASRACRLDPLHV